MNSAMTDIRYEAVSPVEEGSANDKIADMKRIIYNKVKYYLDEEQVFLDPQLSLVRFSSIVGTNTYRDLYTKNGFFRSN